MDFPRKLKAIFFDMDGVLLDSERVWRSYSDEFWNDCGIKELPEELQGKIYGISMSEEHEILVKEAGLTMTLEQYVAQYDTYSERVYTKSALAIELEPTLAELRRKGIRLAIVTSSIKPWIKRFLARLIKSDYFEMTLSIADTKETNQKPSPDGYFYLLKHMNLLPDEVVAVEDSNRGIQAAKSAGIFTMASTEFIDSDYLQTGYDIKISKLSEILKLLS